MGGVFRYNVGGVYTSRSSDEMYEVEISIRCGWSLDLMWEEFK